MTIRFEILTENTKNAPSLGHNLQRIGAMLVLCGLILILLALAAPVAAQVDPSSPPSDVLPEPIDPMQEGAKTLLGEDSPAVRDRDEAKDDIVGWAARNWGTAGRVMEWLFIGIGFTVFGAVTMAVGFSIGGIYGWAIGLVLGVVMGFAVGGQWDLVLDGNVVQLPIMVGLVLLGMRGGEGPRAYMPYSAAVVVFFSILLDPYVTKTGIWELFNVFRLFGADEWADFWPWG